MALHFSANQFNKAFDPKKLQNWEVPKRHRERPRALEGFTQIVANNRGHLLPGVKRSREFAWGNYVGTWDLPLKIPGNHMTNTTARTFSASQRLHRCKTDGEIILNGNLKITKVPDALPVKADVNADQGLKTAPLPPIQSDQEKSPSARSGAMNPIPLDSTSPKVLGTPKPGSPGNVNWPMPGSRAKSASPKLLNTTTNAAVAGSPAPDPELQALTSARTPVNWPPPKSTEPVLE